MDDARTQTPIKVYWQPGCSSCLKTKEFLLANGVDFVSVNVLDDEQGFRDLAKLGLKLVPIVARGDDWAHGAVFRDVARVAGFAWQDQKILPPGELTARIDTILAAAHRFTGQLSADDLARMLPGRPRAYRQLAYHIVNIPDVFLDHVEHGAPFTYEALRDDVPAALEDQAALIAYGAGVRARLDAWWQGAGRATDFTQRADVYYGDVSLHEVLERTTWHSGQHTRQLMLALTHIDIAPDRPLGDDDFAGLPMPNEVWDNEKSFD